jgi:hypothetical protein
VPWFSALAGLYPGASPFVPGVPLHGAVCFGAPGGLVPAASMPHMQAAAPLSAPPSAGQPGTHAALPCALAPPNLREQRSDTPAAAPSLRPDVSVMQRSSQTNKVQNDRKPPGASVPPPEAGRSAQRKRAHASLRAGQQAPMDNRAAGAQSTRAAPQSTAELKSQAPQSCALHQFHAPQQTLPVSAHVQRSTVLCLDVL